MPDRDPLGLSQAQEYHAEILQWLALNQVQPRILDHPEEVRLFDQAGRDLTDEFLNGFRDEFDYFEIESRNDDLQDGYRTGLVSIYTSDFNVYRGDYLVHWNGSEWVLKYESG